jgi:hypothetical protein
MLGWVRDKAQIVICVSRPKSASFSSESGISSRGSKTGEDQKAHFGITFFRHQHKAKKHHCKNYKFILYLLFSNR